MLNTLIKTYAIKCDTHVAASLLISASVAVGFSVIDELLPKEVEFSVEDAPIDAPVVVDAIVDVAIDSEADIDRDCSSS